MRKKEKHLKGFQKLQKVAKREKETHKFESSRCKVLGMGEVETLRGKKLWTQERSSGREIRFLAEEFNISRFNILRGKPQLWNTLKELKACITKEKGVERVVLKSHEVLTCLRPSYWQMNVFRGNKGSCNMKIYSKGDNL